MSQYCKQYQTMIYRSDALQNLLATYPSGKYLQREIRIFIQIKQAFGTLWEALHSHDCRYLTICMLGNFYAYVAFGNIIKVSKRLGSSSGPTFCPDQGSIACKGHLQQQKSPLARQEFEQRN